MGVVFDKENFVFNLKTQNTSYIIGIYCDKIPVHLYYGKRVERTTSMENMTDYQLSKKEAPNMGASFFVMVFYSFSCLTVFIVC